MPTRTVYFSEENLKHATEKESVSGYINELIESDRGGSVEKPFSEKKPDKGTQMKKISGENLLKNLPDGVSVGLAPKVGGLKPKSKPREPGYCMQGHYAGIGMKKCKLCGSRVR